MSIGDRLSRPRGNDIDDREHYPVASAKKVVIVSGDGSGYAIDVDQNGNLRSVIHGNLQQERFDYSSRSDGQPVYAGFADRGVTTSTTSWTLHKFTYDIDGFITVKQTAIDSWDNRVGASYA